eukprot:3936584-Prymnesium_polylepis.1
MAGSMICVLVVVAAAVLDCFHAAHTRSSSCCRFDCWNSCSREKRSWCSCVTLHAALAAYWRRAETTAL